METIKQSGRWPNALYTNRIHYFPHTIKPSTAREGLPYSITAIYWRDKWREDTFYISEEFKNNLILHQHLVKK